MIFRNWNRYGFRYYHLWYMTSFSGNFPSCRSTSYRNLTTFPRYPLFFVRNLLLFVIFDRCWVCVTSRILRTVLVNVDFPFTTTSMYFRIWIQCTVYVVKNILNFTKVILVLIKSKNSFSYIKGHAVHLKDISNRIGIIHQISFDKCRCSSISGYRNVLISLTLELFTSVTRTRQYLI